MPPNSRPNRTMLRRALFLLAACGIAAFAVLMLQLFRLQILRHDELESAALQQQLRRTAIPASRGTIYDREGRVLAMSATTYTVYVSPAEISMNGEDAERIASGLSEILGIDREKILTMTADRRSWYKTVKRQIEEAEADAVRAFKNEYDLQGVKLEPDTKRYYPYASLASHVIGFVGADNTGLSGLEFTQNELLTGTAGSILRLKNSAGTDMILTSYEDYVDAQDGLSLHLTIDTTVQYYLEKQLSQAVQDFDIQNGAAGIIMDPNTGAILAMASLGNFDLNNYQRVSADIQSEIDSTADPDTAAQMLKDAQLAQWRNKAISDTYEPGSTFKIITLAIALEEGAATPSDSFYCGGSMTVQGRGKPLKCWKTIGHESFGFFRASENPDASLTGKTGISLPGESGSIWWPRSVFCNSENFSQLAAASFGQTFNITPLQLITAVSACCNGGYLMKPYIVDSVTDGTGALISKTEPEVLRQVISEKTSAQVNAVLEQVVCDHIAGKTGTSEKVAQDAAGGKKEYIVSFIGYAPADDPQVVCLVLMDTPSNESGIYISGGQMAAPVVGRILGEVLPYLGVQPQYSEAEEKYIDRAVPPLTGKTPEEAVKLLREAGLAARIEGTGDIVTGQLPGKGTVVASGTTVLIYTGEIPETEEEIVPELTGLTYTEAREALFSRGLFLRSDSTILADSDTVRVVFQSTGAGESVPTGSVIEVSIVNDDNDTYGRY